MATGDNKKLDRISTSEILQKLKEVDGDNTQFFYLYVSTAGKEHRRQKRRELPPGQQKLNLPPLSSGDEESDDTESGEHDDEQMEYDNVSTTENISHNVSTSENISRPIPSPDGDTQIVQNIPSLSKDKARSDAMNKVHKVVLPKVLSTDGWMKVYDKDMKLTYRALYFNIIKKNQGEDDNTHIQRVSKIRQKLTEEADQIKKEYDVDFKINSLLSKPFLYDELALEEQSMREGSGKKQSKQGRIDDYFK